MYYEPLPSDAQLARVDEWLRESSPLFVDDFHRHYGGSTPQYFIRSIADFLNLIEGGNWPKRRVSVFRRLYPLRGIADADLVSKALALIREDEAYDILFLDPSDCYPSECKQADGGWKGHDNLMRDLQQPEVAGRLVAVGPCPFVGDESNLYRSPDVLSFDLKALTNEVA